MIFKLLVRQYQIDFIDEPEPSQPVQLERDKYDTGKKGFRKNNYNSV